MTVQVLLFSVLKDTVGAGSLDVDLEHPATAGELWERLASEYAALRPYGGTVRIAVNQTYVNAGWQLHDGDEVALITPVSGG